MIIVWCELLSWY